MKVNVISPWFPDYASVYSGIFVQKMATAVEKFGAEVSVEVPTLFPAPPGNIPKSIVRAMRDLANQSPGALYHQSGSTTFVPTPVPSRSGHVGRASATVESLREKRHHIPVEAEVTHAHLGMPTGWASWSLGDSPLVISEHQSTLEAVFGEPEARDAYFAALSAADAFLCVSAELKEQISTQFESSVTNKIEIVPNVVDLTDIPFTPRSEPDFSTWIYVGALASHKGVPLLLESFAAYRQNVDPDSTLTLVGDGPLRSWVERYASSKSFRRAIDIVGAVEHSNLGKYLKRSGLMVHLSPRETFGIASLEGIGAGLPVVSLRNGGADTAWGDIENECGVIAAPESSSSDIVESIVEMSRNPMRLDPELGRRMVEDRFSSSTIGQILMRIYREVAA